jgi:predicted Zn-ribbon and HTH transcriptional regulator
VLAGKARNAQARIKKDLFTLDHRQHCTGCGQNFVSDRALGLHTCPQNKGPKNSAPVPKAPKTPKAKKGAPTASTPAPAGSPAPAANPVPAGATPGQLGPAHARTKAQLQAQAWRKHNTAQRKADMTRTQRAKDRMSRAWGRAINRDAVCTHCGWVVKDGEAHDCSKLPTPTNLDDPAAVAAKAAASQTAPASAPTATTTAKATGFAAIAAAMTARAHGRKQAQQSAQPNGKGPGMTAPAPAAPAPPASGNGAPRTGGGGGTGGGAGAASAQALVQAMSAWANEMPNTHEEMTAKMNATRAAMSQMGSLVGQFQQAMVAKGFHPECVQPLTGTATHLAEAGNGCTEALMAIERVYAALLAHYRSGTPDPGQTYLSDGRRPPGT